jgi:hypothetical protein
MEERVEYIKKHSGDLNYQEAMKIIGLIVECDESDHVVDNNDGSRVDLHKLTHNTVTKIYHLIKFKIKNKMSEEPTLPHEVKLLH